jgi:hypothetical protein
MEAILRSGIDNISLGKRKGIVLSNFQNWCESVETGQIDE